MDGPICPATLAQWPDRAAVHVPAADTDAVITLTAPGAKKAWVITEIDAGYSDDASAGETLIVVAGSTTILSLPWLKGGPGPLRFPGGLFHSDSTGQIVFNEAVVVTLTAAGGAIVGRLNVRYK